MSGQQGPGVRWFEWVAIVIMVATIILTIYELAKGT